jgi:hypothetical protein
MKEKFQFFGSKSSEDYDVMVFVDSIPNTEECKNLCAYYNDQLLRLFKYNNMIDKELNSNIAVIKDGIIHEIFKGTTDEANNSLFLTYDYHQQFHKNEITRLIERDVDIKMMRCARSILMILSRSKYRSAVKLALRSNFAKKIEILEKIDYSLIVEEDIKERFEFKDAIKMLAFQLGQTLALIDGIELYTKEDIVLYYPTLSDMMFRKRYDMTEIEKLKNNFVISSKRIMKNMKIIDEYKK